MTEYTRRQLDDITRSALKEFADIPDTRSEARNRARAALARMDHRPEPDLREPYVYRYTLQPGLHLVVDASHNILLEVRTVDESELLAAYALSGVMGMINQLEVCRDARDAADADAETERRRGLAERQQAIRWSEPRPGEDAASRAAALAELTGAGLNTHSAQLVLKRAYGHLGGSFNVPGSETLGTTHYDREAGTYAVRLPEPEEDTGPVPQSHLRLQDRPGYDELLGQLHDLAPAVSGPDTAAMAGAVADELSRHGITGIEFADGSPLAGQRHYEATSGIRPPNSRGKVRAVVYENEPGGGIEVWHCEHDHAPGVRDLRRLSDAQRGPVQDCAVAWLAEQVRGGRDDLPVVRC